jgi:hypothetical protein
MVWKLLAEEEFPFALGEGEVRGVDPVLRLAGIGCGVVQLAGDDLAGLPVAPL